MIELFRGSDYIRYTFMRFPGGKGKAVTLSYDDNAPENKRFSDV